MKSLNRRDVLTAGAAALLGNSLLCREVRGEQVPTQEINFWKYTKIDPAKTADLAYEIYPGGACMYAIVRALLTAVADAQRPLDPLAASVISGFPFQMMKYGHAGIAATGSICGALNGGAAVIGLFVDDAIKRDAMIQELCIYYERTELPKYKPKENKFPETAAVTVKPESVLCHISSTRWRAAAKVPMFAAARSDRCRRLTSDIVIKTAELLNRYHTDKTSTFAALPQPTATCFDCHGRDGTKSDTIVRMNCASCHDKGERHIERHRQ